jgi:hypothetical protein
LIWIRVEVEKKDFASYKIQEYFKNFLEIQRIPKSRQKDYILHPIINNLHI